MYRANVAQAIKKSYLPALQSNSFNNVS